MGGRSVYEKLVFWSITNFQVQNRHEKRVFHEGIFNEKLVFYEKLVFETLIFWSITIFFGAAKQTPPPITLFIFDFYSTSEPNSFSPHPPKLMIWWLEIEVSSYFCIDFIFAKLGWVYWLKNRGYGTGCILSALPDLKLVFFSPKATVSSLTNTKPISVQ